MCKTPLASRDNWGSFVRAPRGSTVRYRSNSTCTVVRACGMGGRATSTVLYYSCVFFEIKVAYQVQ